MNSTFLQKENEKEGWTWVTCAQSWSLGSYHSSADRERRCRIGGVKFDLNFREKKNSEPWKQEGWQILSSPTTIYLNKKVPREFCSRTMRRNLTKARKSDSQPRVYISLLSPPPSSLLARLESLLTTHTYSQQALLTLLSISQGPILPTSFFSHTLKITFYPNQSWSTQCNPRPHPPCHWH